MKSYDYGGWWPEPSRPLEAKGGIKTQQKRVGTSANWWAKRWIGTLESFNMGARLTRGRSYARQGQVLSVDVVSGKVKARVQGSRATPYTISIGVKILSESQWAKVTDVLSGQAIFVAKLLAGEMPQEIETAFEQAGVSLLPRSVRDLDTDCSCPDWANPCKHIAAVYYLLGEEFDRDPFLIFKLRGLSRDDLVSALGKASPADPDEPAMPPEPLSAELASFWEGTALPPDLTGEVRIPPVHAALPTRLGSLPFWRAEIPFLEAMQSDYAAASPAGLKALGE